MNLNIYGIFKSKYNLNVKLVNASNFSSKLKNISDLKKRKIIGNLFIKIFEKESKSIKI